MATQVSIHSCPSPTVAADIVSPVNHLPHNCLIDQDFGGQHLIVDNNVGRGDAHHQQHLQQQQHLQPQQHQQPMPVLLRTSIARSIYERMQREEQLRFFDKTKWYSIDRHLVTDELHRTFRPSDYDCETREFVDLCYQKSDQYFTHLFHSIARTILCLFMSSTSVNGLLGRGSMFVFSDQQFRTLLNDDAMSSAVEAVDSGQRNGDYCSPIDLSGAPMDTSSDHRILIDLGAGDGKITEIMSKYFHKTYTTEISSVMRKILLKKGYHVLDVEDWHENGRQYDVISCLNVLDRCDRPLSMLADMKSALRPRTGRIVLALVLPFSQYVEVSATDNHRTDHRPSEVLAIEGHTFEEQLVSFVDRVLRPNGLQVVTWTKVPYLCEGDLELTYYWLYDVVMVLKTADQ
ncbi:unnamed protein product [Medioppia subpectinata]|uniref:Methyltransferase-like protein 9 n=1 Tax=Medioppia subpectinata TaxID=1979941 RepID=A0A7R9KJV9_9ACAR|nr:unnamed protein product [Medioppia subpectinata]CAG2103525.1 unnamed protein product [Medioppia subpectinata]